jgi:DNA topoisomerase-3
MQNGVAICVTINESLLRLEAKETRPPPRYSEGTLIEAMANAWRFVENPEHRERLKEAKGIGTPATRAEVIQGLKRQDLLTASGKHIVPTERGLALFGILEGADRALVDPAVTAKLEFLLDEVLVGRRRAEEAIDAVCGQAARIIGRLLGGAPSGGAVLPPVASTRGRKVPASGKRNRRTFPRPGLGPTDH